MCIRDRFTVCLTSYLYLDSSFLSSKDQDRLGDGSIGGQMVTPDEIKEDVSYFLVAGVDLSTNLTDTIMLVCFDHKAGEASILQIPDVYKRQGRAFRRAGGACRPAGGLRPV